MSAPDIAAAIRLAHKIADNGIEMWLDGACLRYRAPRGTFTPELREMVKRYKADILAAFEQGSLEIVTCPGDDCSETLLLIDGSGYCKHHEMAVRLVDKLPF